ncbi:Hypothetical predicted protein [Pelobates cultripes]|uniref:Deleted in lung and esophageal cancer protein 1 n=1 Tax=Pelobates cultripes TaxID=61616 RepID=A0AAD1W2T4_PELCU|nr:Hypothetical predicted protein [Pelobates cultripes]
MSTDELLQKSVTLSSDPATYWPKPSSERTQDISHLLTSLFKDLYTGEVIGKDTGANLIRSGGGDNPYHKKFVEDLQQIRTEYEHQMAEADMVERHIIEARARAAAEEERILREVKNDAGERFQTLGLPPVDSYFRWCVDSNILRKHKLICPDDYITDIYPLTKAPKGQPEPSHFRETFSFHQRISRSPVDDGYTEFPMPESKVFTLDDSLSDLTLSSTSDILERSKKRPSKKSTPAKQVLWKEGMSAEEREKQRSKLAQLEKRHNFLRNPRFLPPHSMHGGRSLIVPTKKTERTISGRKIVVEANDPQEPVPIFLANPPVVFFPDYEVGQIYEMTIELRNMTASSRHVRVIPPSTPYFSICLGKFPGEGGIVAPGMSCHYTIRFVPDSLADFEDYILVETQAPYPVLVPIEARRAPPALTIPHTLDCGPCLVGGVKVMEWICRNDGMSRGRFCIMPKSAWPPASFRSVATGGFVEKGPFGIHPSFFELYPGQEIIIEVVFFPSSPETYNHVFTIACDNCQVKDVILAGCGELAGLEVVSIGGESTAEAGEITDVSAKHMVQFPPTNLCSCVKKSLVIWNSTHVPLPFYWQIIKPSLQTLLPGAAVDIAESEETTTAFSISPTEGVIGPHQAHTFSVTYKPTKLIEYHSIAQMVLQDIPDPSSVVSQAVSLATLEASLKDAIVLDMEFKGSTEAFNILLLPYTIIFPGEGFIGTTMRKEFQMWNRSRSDIYFKWENVTSCHIVHIEPKMGRIEPNAFCQFELSCTGGQIGFTSQKVKCHIEHSSEPVILGVEATFKGPVVTIDVPSLDLGLIKLGNKAVSIITIVNNSSLVAKWRMQESRACISERGEEESPFFITPEKGELPPLGTAKLKVLFQPLACQRLETTLQLQVDNGEASYLPVSASVQLPQACLLSSLLQFPDMYVGVPAQGAVKIFNQGHLPAKFTWGELTGSHAIHCSSSISPASGTLGPNEEVELHVDLTVHSLDELSNLAFQCTIEDMVDPLVLTMKAKAQGLHVSYSLFDEDETLPGRSSEELLLDFGSEVVLQNKVQRKLVLTNHTGISAPFSLEAAFFNGCPVVKAEEHSLSLTTLIQRTAQYTELTANRAQKEFMASVLSDGKGAAFIPQPISGTLGAFQQVTIEVTAYNNLWGEYTDHLICKVGDLTPKEIPMKMIVKGCPIYFQMTGPRADRQTEGPIIRFGTHMSGGDTISRCLRINNPSPCDIRIDWETYNREQDTSQLVDLVVLFGDPFPLKDIDGNEIVGRRSEFSESQDSSMNWDQIPNTSGTMSQASSENGNFHEAQEQADTDVEESNQYDEELPPDKLISIIVRPHEGIASDYPYCITPRQTIVPAGGSSVIHVSFTPLMLSAD